MNLRPLFLACATAAVVVVAACGSDGASSPDGLAGGPSLAGESLSSDPLGLFLKCEVLPYESQTVVVDHNGGTIVVGPHKLSVPRGAIPRKTKIAIKMEAVSDSVSSVRLSPEGTRFLVPVKLKLGYKHCEGGKAVKKRVAYTTEDLTILEWPVSNDDAGALAVEAELDHFSKYAVAY